MQRLIKSRTNTEVMLRKCMFLLLLLTSHQALAQDPFFKQIQINRDNLNLGFNKLMFDHNRSLWIGTSEGLYNYNGRDFTVHQYNKAGANQEVTALYCSKEGRIWAGMKNGDIGVMQDTTLIPLAVKGLLPKAAVTSICEDKDGVMWFATGGDGVYYLAGDSLHRINSESGLTDDYVYIITEHEGKLWMGTDQGVTTLVKANSQMNFSSIDVDDGLPDFIVRDILAGKDGKLWLALQDSGICIYNTNTRTVEVPSWTKGWKFGQVNSILIDKDEMWIATETAGVLCIDLSNGETRIYKEYGDLRFTEVKQLIHDAEEHTWFISQAGLIQSHGNWLTFLNEVNAKKISYVHAVYCNSKGQILFTPDQGLSIITRTGNDYSIRDYTVTPPEDLIDIVSLYEDNSGNIWLGTMGGGLFRFSISSEKVERIEHPFLENASVLSIAGKGNDLWLATFGGAFKCTFNDPAEELEVVVTKLDEKLLGNFYIYDVYIDSRGRIWFGTDQKGLICFTGEEHINYTINDGLRSNTVFSITEDDKGALWFSIANEGICRYDGRSFKSYGAAEGLRELNVSALKSVTGNRLIMVHRRGIDILHTSTGNIDYYGTTNNLSDINPDINSIAVDNEGKAWIGTEKGLVIYNPSKAGSPAGPSVFIDRVSLFGSSTNMLNKNIFRHDENNLSFNFSGIWYTDPDRISYQYMLEGYNNSWINTRDRQVIFPNLPPGSYVFRVRASLSPGFYLNQSASYTFSISKPFWREGWFLAILSVVTVAAAMGYIKQRDKRLKGIEALKKESVEYRFETLKSQVNPHFLFNSFNTLIAIIEKDKDVAIEYVEKLSDYFRNMIQHRDKETISLRDEIEMVKTYYYLQKKRFGDYLNLTINIDPELLVNTKVPPLSLQLLIENAIKHNAVSRTTPLNVEIIQTGVNTIRIRNNINKKINKEVSTGIGLDNIVNRYKILTKDNVEINFDNHIFEVTLPLIS